MCVLLSITSRLRVHHADSYPYLGTQEEFYTEPPLPDELLDTRRKIAHFSLPLSQRRLRQQRAEAELPIARVLEVRRKVYTDLKKTQLLGSQIGDTRPISTVKFSPCSSMIATGSWSGGAKIWGVPNLNEVASLRGPSPSSRSCSPMIADGCLFYRARHALPRVGLASKSRHQSREVNCQSCVGRR